jgi:nicotinate phosphoribosyltransferase
MDKLEINNYLADLADTDLYKLTMQQAMVYKYSKAKVRYKFYLRSDIDFPDGFGIRLQELVQQMRFLTLSDEMFEYLSKIRFFTSFFLEYLKSYRYNPGEVMIYQEGGKLSITIEGFGYRTILWETQLLALISQLYYEMEGIEYDKDKVKKYNNQKANFVCINALNFADFGTRRRRSLQHHINTLKIYKERTLINNEGMGGIIGTSNPYMAKKFDIQCVGTHAHEWFMFHCIAYSFEKSTHFALEAWSDVYNGDLGIALTDTLTTDIFLKSFRGKMPHLFKGVRHDSSNPITFGEKIIEHYKSLGINPQTKEIIFSDSLDFGKALTIEKHFMGKIKTNFGIGTFISNDIPDQDALSIVIKLDSVKIDEYSNWETVIKLSDDKGKNTGDGEKIKLVKKILKIK